VTPLLDPQKYGFFVFRLCPESKNKPGLEHV
jgi:hypothetical protein